MNRPRQRRRRPALSCVECRRRKIKCDRNDPCSHCVATNAQCTFKLFGDDPVGLSGDLSAASVHITPVVSPRSSGVNSPGPDVEQKGGSSSVRGVGNLPNTSTTASVSGASREKDRGRDPGSELQVSRTNPVSSLSQTGQSILASQFGLRQPQILLNKTRTLRSSHWMGMAQEFEYINSCYMAVTGETTDGEWFQDEETKASIAQIGDLLRKCKVIAKTLKIGRPSRSLLPPQPDLIPPPGDVSDNLVNLYLQFFEPVLRIFHTPSFWAEYRQFRGSPQTAKPEVLKVLLVIGLGSSLSTPDPALSTRAQQWLYVAQTWLAGPLEKDRLSVSGIQIYCLTLFARQVFAIGGDLVWMSTGDLIHRAMQMGLHRDPKHLPPMSSLQAEIRRRLWATILELTVQSSLDAAMPPRISLDEFDTEAPSNVNDDELNESNANVRQHPKTTYTESSVQLALLESVATRLRVLQALNGLHANISYEEALSLSSELTSTLQKCGQFVKDNKENGVDAFHSNLIDYLVRRFLIPLHCAFACKARTNPLFQSSLKCCLDTALALISPEPSTEFSHLMAMGGGLFREGVRYTCSVISLELMAETEAQNNDGTLHRNSAYRSILKKATEDLLGLSAERIRQGETNVKMHMFLSMIMAQVTAIEEGRVVERDMAQAGRDSLEFCYGLLQERASNVALPTPNSQDISLPLDGWRYETNVDWNTEFLMPSTMFF